MVHLSTWPGLPRRRWARTSTQRAHCLPSVDSWVALAADSISALLPTPPPPRTPELFYHTWAFTTPATRHTATETNHCPLASATQIPTPVKSLRKIPHLDLLFLKRLCIVHCLL